MTIPQNTDPSHGDGNGTPPPHGGTSGSHGDQSSTSTPTLEELQKQLADLQSKNAEFLADNKKYRAKQKEQEEAARLQEAADRAKEEARLREQSQFKELAEKYGAEVQQLKPVQERYNALSAVLADQLKVQTKEWPQEVKDLLPADDTPIEDRYAQVQKLQAFVDKLNASAAPQTRPGNGPNPKPATPTPEGYQQKLENQLRASGKYRA